MAALSLGQQGEDIANLQQMLAYWYRTDRARFKPLSINGTFDEATRLALIAWQKAQKLPATGVFDTKSYARASAIAKYATKGATASPWYQAKGFGIRSIAEDRTWVHEQYMALFGKPPTNVELERATHLLQGGNSRASVTSTLSKKYAPEAVTKIYQDVLGREPTAAERAAWEGKIATGSVTRAGMTQYLSSTNEARNRPQVTTPVEGAEDSRVIMNGMLDNIGLGSLKDWAWEQIQAGHSAERIMQDLRITEAYQTRFRGLTERVAQGLPAMTEREYLEYEESAEQIMRANGLPTVFRTQERYAELIAGNVSLAELNERVQEGFVRVNMAPPEVRDKFAQWFGPAGDSALAAFFLDKEKALPALREQIATAEVGGIGAQFDLDFTYDRASKIAQAGVDKDSARSGFAQIQQLDPLFQESVSEEEDLTAIDEGADAVFDLGGRGATALERRGRERVAATSGGGGANVGSTGTGAGTAD